MKAGHFSAAPWLRAIVVIMLESTGCMDVGCPSGRLAIGKACACPWPESANGECVPPDAGAPVISTTDGKTGTVPGDSGSKTPVDPGTSTSSAPPRDASVESTPAPPTTGDGSTPRPNDAGTSQVERCRASCDGTCDAEGRCIASEQQQQPQCGNKILEAGEECETGGASNWDATNCANCERKFYRLCDRSSPNPCGTTDEWCNLGVCTPKVEDCSPPPVKEQLQLGREDPCVRKCPWLPGARGVLLDWSNNCFLRCTDPAASNECPAGLTCWRSLGFASDPGEEPPYVCAAPG